MNVIASKNWIGMPFNEVRAYFYESSKIVKDLLDEGFENDSCGYYKEFKEQLKDFRTQLCEEKTFYWVNKEVWNKLEELDRELCTIKAELENYIKSYYF